MNPLKLPPTYFLLAVLAQFGLAWWFPGPPLEAVRAIIGGAFLLLGSLGVLAAALAFFRHRTPILPFREPSRLLTDGIYRYTRNPIYASEAVLLLGLAVLHGSPWTLLPIPAFVLVLHLGFIRPEERILRKTFGEAFEAYRKQVRPWF